MDHVFGSVAQAIVSASGASLSVAGVELALLSLTLVVLGLAIGTVAVMAGVGGGVLFVPIATALLPIHVDYIRGAGLMVALVGAVAAAPRLLRGNLAQLRVAIPFALCSSVGSIVGARIGFLVATDSLLLLLGGFMIFIAVQTSIGGIRARYRSRSASDPPQPTSSAATLSDRLAERWELHGTIDGTAAGGRGAASWRARRIVPAMGGFVGIGGIGGMLGVGAGWANVPVLHGLVGLPLKMAAATSGLIIVANASAAAWVYLDRGALAPLIVVPAVIGMVLGTRAGARLLTRASGGTIRLIVIILLGLTGIRTVLGALS